MWEISHQAEYIQQYSHSQPLYLDQRVLFQTMVGHAELK